MKKSRTRSRSHTKRNKKINKTKKNKQSNKRKFINPTYLYRYYNANPPI